MTSSAGTFTYWSLLGVASNSNSEELKRAFRKEARIWHPDLNGNSKLAEERFKWINEAYSVLSDPRKKLAWEAAGRPAFELREIDALTKEIDSQSNQFQDQKPSPAFTSAEKLLLILISVFFSLFLNSNVF